mgnify:CR=1 FL=1
MNSLKGFTLIELLVAMAIFAVLAALAYGTLSQTLLSSEILTNRMTRLEDIQRSVRMLTNDLHQLSPRPVRDQVGNNLRPAMDTSFQSGFAIELTRSGWSNPVSLPRSTLQRVGYRIEENELIRYHWYSLDRTLNTDPVSQVLLTDVEGLEFRFLLNEDEFTDRWPPPDITPELVARLRPRAVEIILLLFDEGRIRRLIEVAP